MNIKYIKHCLNKSFLIVGFSIISLFFMACEDFVEIDPPITETVRETIFSSDESALVAMNGVYVEMIDGGSMFSGNLEVFTGLASDELDNLSSISTRIEFEANDVLSNDSNLFSIFWQNPYQIINNANAIIEELSNNQDITAEVGNQLTGEALFIRAYAHVYLFGAIPYSKTTDVELNNSAVRMPIEDVYENIIEDLVEAESLLSEDYSFVENGRRVRPNQSTAKALLARVYLYTEDWANAAALATEVIDRNDLYVLANNLNDVFLVDSGEAIFQLASVNQANELERSRLGDLLVIARFPLAPLSVGTTGMNDELFSAFESGDERFANWVGSFTSFVGTNNFANKYKNSVFLDEPEIPEHTTLLRLAEQYLIRAEARAQQGNVTGAQEDLNTIRNRAGLGSTPASDQTSLIEAILQERRVELFAENGHRWLDLKRTGRAGAVLGPIKSGWQDTDVLLPIPDVELENNANLLPQNPGY